jgi:hypothetical protein
MGSAPLHTKINPAISSVIAPLNKISISKLWIYKEKISNLGIEAPGDHPSLIDRIVLMAGRGNSESLTRHIMNEAQLVLKSL